MPMDRKQAVIAVVGVLMAVLCPVWISGCGGYGEVSESAYEHATALYSICNRQDESRLERFATMVDEARSSGSVSSKEADWLMQIVDLARTGEWEEAASKSRRMLQDQVTRG